MKIAEINDHLDVARYIANLPPSRHAVAARRKEVQAKRTARVAKHYQQALDLMRDGAWRWAHPKRRIDYIRSPEYHREYWRERAARLRATSPEYREADRQAQRRYQAKKRAART